MLLACPKSSSIPGKFQFLFQFFHQIGRQSCLQSELNRQPGKTKTPDSPATMQASAFAGKRTTLTFQIVLRGFIVIRQFPTCWNRGNGYQGLLIKINPAGRRAAVVDIIVQGLRSSFQKSVAANLHGVMKTGYPGSSQQLASEVNDCTTCRNGFHGNKPKASGCFNNSNLFDLRCRGFEPWCSGQAKDNSGGLAVQYDG